MGIVQQGVRIGAGAETGPAFFAATVPSTAATERSRGGWRVLACLDDGDSWERILDEALAVGRALELGVAAARVIETSRHLGAPADPVEWQLRRRENLTGLDRAVTASARKADRIERVLLAGPAADELIGWARENDVALMALGTHATGSGEAGLGNTAQKVLERASASLLLVPAGAASRHPYRRILAPLDGSARAESVLPVAFRIARFHGAELILAHVVPRPQTVGARLGGGRAQALCHRLSEQNEKGARDYLDGLEAQLWRERLPVRAIVLTEGDPRGELRRLALEQSADLVIVTCHGEGGMSDMPCGSVAEYLATHAPVPLLIVRPEFGRVLMEANANQGGGVRSPSPGHV